MNFSYSKTYNAKNITMPLNQRWIVKQKVIDEFFDEIVANVKKERVKRGISQLALAQILGHKSPNYIAKIETRKHGVCYNLHHLFIIATEFDMDLRDLVPNTKEAK